LFHHNKGHQAAGTRLGPITVLVVTANEQSSFQLQQNDLIAPVTRITTTTTIIINPI
jgi:hypothetical protein